MTNPPLDRALAERYTVLREIGAGGMATVFLAEDLRHRRKVAIKVLHPELSAVIGSDRFLKEIELTANLQHPHILPLFDSGDVNGQLYYVMPFVEGETLRSRLDREQQLPVSDALRIAREVADALAYAHKRGVVHRDIKPENVLLQDGHALVADFGIALAVQQAGQGRMTQTGLSLGTPQYMSPEQAMGERSIDHRADIYALGAVTYEMLAGEAPFTGPTAQAIIARAMTERPRSLVSIRETLSPAVDHAVSVALSKLPADRFSSAAEFADALVQDGVPAGRTTTFAQAPSRRRWLPWAGVAAGLLLGALGMRAATGGAKVVATEEPRFWSIVLPDSAPFVEGHDPYDMYLRSLDISPDGRSIVWATMRDSTPMFWEVRTDLGEVLPLSGTAGGAVPTYSPSGDAVAFATGSQVKRIDRGSTSAIRLGERNEISDILWPSTDQIITNDYYGCMMSVPATGGTSVRYPTHACSANGGLSKGPDARRLLVGLTGAIGFLDVTNGAVQYVRRMGYSDTTDRASLLQGDVPMLINSNTLAFMRDSTLYAAHFNTSTGQLKSEPRQIITGVRHEAQSGAAAGQVALSASGTLVWVSGADASVSHFVFVSPKSGAVDTVALPPTNVNSYALTRDGKRLAYSVNLPGNAAVLRILDLQRNVIDSARFPMDIEVANWVDADSGISVTLPATQQGSRRHGIVRGIGSTMTLDTTGADYYGSSANGELHCSSSGVFFPKSSPKDSVRFDRGGNWCRFSPDGTMISWDDLTGLLVAPTTSSAAASRRRVAPAGANEARWTADGKELLYRTGNQWLAVPAQPSPDGKLTPPRLVLRGTYNQAYASWDLTADGRLLLLQGVPPVRKTQLNVITNFPRYVEQKLAATPK